MSGADLEYRSMLARANKTAADKLDGASLEQLGDERQASGDFGGGGGGGGGNLPAGGTTGQLLRKNSNLDNDASWANTAPQADKLTNARELKIAGAATGVSFDGTAAVEIPAPPAQDLTPYATKAGSVNQFADWDDAAPVEDYFPQWDATLGRWIFRDPSTQFAPVDINGRLAAGAWQQYFLPMVVIDQGDAPPVGFPAGGIVFERSELPSLIPILTGQNSGTGTSNTLVITTSVSMEVGAWIGVAVMGSGEATLPITHTFGLSAGAWTLDSSVTLTQPGSIYGTLYWFKVTTAIPAASTITITYSANRVLRGAITFIMPNLVAASPFDNSAAENDASTAITNITVGPTTALAQPRELSILLFAHNDSSGTTTRPVVGTNGYNVIAAAEADNGSSSRTITMLYKVIEAGGTVIGTCTVNASDGQTGSWVGIVANFKAD